MSRGNSRGTYRTTTELKMKAFDKLPKDVRIALANADHSWAPQQCLTDVKLGLPTQIIINNLEFADERQRLPKRMDKVWGKGHPQVSPIGGAP